MDYVKRNKIRPAVELSERESKPVIKKIDTILDRLNGIKQQKDLRVYRGIIREHEVSVNVIALLLIATVVIRIVMLMRRKKGKTEQNSPGKKSID